jgi:uncharacterized protein (DUF1330 family)
VLFIAENSGKAVAATNINSPEVLGATGRANWTVIIEFPSMDDANCWYASPAHQAAIPTRPGAARLTNIAIVRSLRPD